MLTTFVTKLLKNAVFINTNQDSCCHVQLHAVNNVPASFCFFIYYIGMKNYEVPQKMKRNTCMDELFTTT